MNDMLLIDTTDISSSLNQNVWHAQLECQTLVAHFHPSSARVEWLHNQASHGHVQVGHQLNFSQCHLCMKVARETLFDQPGTTVMQQLLSTSHCVVHHSKALDFCFSVVCDTMTDCKLLQFFDCPFSRARCKVAISSPVQIHVEFHTPMSIAF